MTRKMIILLSATLLSLSMAQQLPFGDNLDRWWFLAVPAVRNLSIFSSNSNPSGSRPMAIRDDYTYTAGVGTHKVHTRPTTWHEARRICDLEGGHLAIINSVAEANIVVNQAKQLVPSLDWTLIGLHDLFVPGEHLTMHNQPLAKAGYSQWAPGEPSNPNGGAERCGCISKDIGIADVTCDIKRTFVCELPTQ